MDSVVRGSLSVALACFCMTALAKTVALWPLGWDEANQCRDGHCAVDSANDLSFDSNLVCSYMTDGWGWTLPPNPDPDHRVENVSALYSCGTSNAKNFAYSTTVGKYLTADRDFTLEGWFRFPTLPAKDKKFFVADCGGLTAGHRWFLTFRGPESNKRTCYSWQIFFEALGTGDAVLYELTDADAAAIRKGWHHWAFVFNHSDAEGKAVISFYQDGKLLGSLEKNAYGGTVSGNRFFGLGCRDNTGDAFTGFLDYCRLSDCALDPSQFLYVGKAETSTVALWKLDRTADGGVSGAPSVGSARLYGGYFTYPAAWNSDGKAAYNYSAMRPDVDCAFAGNPPNPTVVLPDGNFGSMFACEEDVRTEMRIQGIGGVLSFSNDFTVEGWLKICRQTDSSLNSYFHHICGTRLRQDGGGWCFQYHGVRGQAQLELYANDGSTAIANATVGSLADCEDRWIHLALAYDHADGNGKGVWRTYIDGTPSGCVTNSVVPKDVSETCPDFRFGGLLPNAPTPYAMIGKLDCWRVAKAALRPTQLMCAREGAEAATNVEALWPLNVQNGAWLDGRDVVGSYTFESPRPSPKYLAAGSSDAPSVPGVTSPKNGAATFNSGTTGSQSTLMCVSTTVSHLFDSSNTDGWTMEWYVKRTAEAVTGKNEFLVISTLPSKGLDISPDIGYMNLQYRSTGFWFFERNSVSADTQFADAQGNPSTLPVGEWKHVALTRRVSGTSYVYELFIDGLGRGTITANSPKPESPGAVQFGGRNSSENSWKGAISSIRITRGVLSPSEFLCAQSIARQTAAFWSLESSGGTVDLSARSPNQALAFVTAVNVAGSDDRALPRVPNSPDGGVNVGSISLLSGSRAETPIGGECVGLNVPFTVEGWLKVSQFTPGRTTIAGNYTGNGGWKLVLDATGSVPTVRIYAKGDGERGVIVDQILLANASAFLQGWHHLALIYDPAIGNGEWSLLVDRRRAGFAVRNAERPVADSSWQPFFRLGADADDGTCAGLYDMWRVSTAVLAKSELLFPPPGLMLTIR